MIRTSAVGKISMSPITRGEGILTTSQFGFASVITRRPQVCSAGKNSCLYVARNDPSGAPPQTKTSALVYLIGRVPIANRSILSGNYIQNQKNPWQ
jgi:hypothetical protein